MITPRTPSLEEVSRGVTLAVLEGVGKATAKDVDRHNAEASALAASIASLDETVRRTVDSVADCEEGSGFEFGDALESRQVERLRLYQETARLWKQRGEVAEAMASELLPPIEAAEQRHADAMAATLTGLDKLGLSPQAMLAGDANPTAAQQQQAAIARQALPVRAAAADEQDAKVRRNAAAEAVATSKRRLEEAKSVVRRIAEKAAALA